ncbi:MAG TPA: SHOCT domain-containing protein [Vicinamibacteria bacterium]|nr:SHOCT domain-containing protein [Vicinamibacteria bacterium]
MVRLAKARQMLDQGLITEAEYDSLKARILGNL